MPYSACMIGFISLSALVVLSTVDTPFLDHLPAPQERIELAMLAPDLRADVLRSTKKRLRWEQVLFAQKAFENETIASWLFGMKSYVDALDPSGAPVPLGVFVYTDEQNRPKGVVRVKVTPGFEERLSALSNEAMELSFESTEKGLTLKVGERVVLVGQLNGLWLDFMPPSIATELPHLKAEGPLFESDLDEYTQDGNFALWVKLDGFLASFLGAQIKDPTVKMILTGAKSLLISSAVRENETKLSLILDAPALRPFEAMVRPSSLDARMLQRMGPELSSAISIALPKPLLQTGLMLGEKAMREQGLALPDMLAKSLKKLSGVINFVAYPSRSDWAVGLQFENSKAAAAFLPGMFELKKSIEGRKSAAWQLSDSEALFFSKESLSGLSATQSGSFVVLGGQRARMKELGTTLGLATVTEKHGLAGPTTPWVKELLKKPAILGGYSVIGDTAGLYEIWSQFSGLILVGMRAAAHRDPKIGSVVDKLGVLDDLQLILQTTAFLSEFIYDWGVAVDLRDERLSLQIVGSEL